MEVAPIRIMIALLILIALTMPASAGSLAMHTAVGDWCGRVAASDQDAAILGFASHALLDTWFRQNVVNWQDKTDMRRQKIYLAADIALAGAVAWRAAQDEQNQTRRMVGIAAALAPDVIDGVYALIYPDRWMKGDLLLPWHDSIRVQMGPTQTMLWAVGITAASW
jgi:hypothetical protein